MIVEDELKIRLAELADQATPTASPREAVHAHVTRLRRRRHLARWGGAVLVTAMTLTAATFGFSAMGLQGQMPASPPDGPFLSWPTVGDPDSPVVSEAVRTWSPSSAGTDSAGVGHSDVRALLVTRGPLGPVVILQGRDTAGTPRLAFFTGSPDALDGPLVLRADRPAPDPTTTRVVSLVTARVGTGVGHLTRERPAQAWVVALAAPGTDRLTVSSTGVDMEMSDGTGPKGRAVVTGLSSNSSAVTTTITAHAGGVQEYRAQPQGGIGDPVPVPAASTSRVGEHRLELSITHTSGIAMGQLVVNSAGLVGRVSAVRGSTVEAEALTSPSFSMPAYTNISNHAGTIRGSGDGVEISELPARAAVAKGNRVVVDDPAQGGPEGAVTVGRLDAGKAPNDRIDPAVDPRDLGQVYVLTPYTEG
ncbi:MAG TPA: rod shape-determining protein MreC [Micromonosporaceae bacterium]|nr:rod shape-determining protein MreC [Micromonosporaceae bacterium]